MEKADQKQRPHIKMGKAEDKEKEDYIKDNDNKITPHTPYLVS